MNSEHLYADVLIIGSGIAGLYTALNLSDNLNILIVTKSKTINCNSYLAQGGISTALNKEDEELFVNDTLRAGNYKNNLNAVKTLVAESIENIDTLIKLGVPFDLINNKLDYTREGCHSVNRIVHCKDKTGEKVFETLKEKACSKTNITIIEDACLVDIINVNNLCYGGVFLNKDKIFTVNAKQTVLACGGIGGLFIHSTNDRSLRGSALSIALRHSIKVKDLQYIQFHPTSLYEENSTDRSFLISESLRGEGALLFNCNNERFIDELLPRDVVTEAIKKEISKSHIPYVYLDISHKPSDFIKTRFPSIYKKCMEKGYDITKERIPVCPAQHYFMGGIEVNLNSETSMKNLFAVGEVSCTGVHGNNRLASNSLLEALVFSRRASHLINNSSIKSSYYAFDKVLDFSEYTSLIKNDEILIIDKLKNLRSDIKNELVCS